MAGTETFFSFCEDLWGAPKQGLKHESSGQKAERGPHRLVILTVQSLYLRVQDSIWVQPENFFLALSISRWQLTVGAMSE